MQRQVQRQLLFVTLGLSGLLLVGILLSERAGITPPVIQVLVATVVPWLVICALIWRGLPFHAHAQFGAANTLTLYRAAGTVLLASWLPVVSQLSYTGFWWLSLSSVFLLTLDGLDGYLARRTGLASPFGARFDMEIDALLTLVISLLVWQSGETGIWILALGLMRYAFVLAGLMIKSLDKPLFPSFRRKLICVIQLAALCAILSPWVEAFWSTALGLSACVLLAASFCRDAHWLMTQPS